MFNSAFQNCFAAVVIGEYNIASEYSRKINRRTQFRTAGLFTLRTVLVHRNAMAVNLHFLS